MNYLMTFLCVLVASFIGYVACAPTDAKVSKVSGFLEKETSTGDLEKRDWTGMKAAWGKRAGEEEEMADFPNTANFANLADLADLAEIPQRETRGPNTWQSGLGAWGKRSGNNWGQNLRAWGKRTPDWTNEYMQNLQRQMEAVKNRRASNWQLASWGRRR